MISFHCRCSHPFCVPEDQAGASIQCPECGLLNDVPLLGDAASLEPDGTFRVQEDADTSGKGSTGRLAELERAFSHRRVDPSGQEIDLRTTLEQVRRMGDPPQTSDKSSVAAPRYDPETGELIRPLELAEPREPPTDSIPLAKPVLSYSIQPAEAPLTAMGILLRLFYPENLVVVVIVLATLIIGQVVSVFFLAVMSLAGPMFRMIGYVPLWAVIFLITAHYGTVIDDTGRVGKDQLPRPLRDMNWHEDLWGMFAKMAGGFIICYWPVLVMNLLARKWPGLADWNWVLWIAALCFLPTVWLILIGGGSILNLRPDRVVKTLWRLGPGYLLLLPALALGLISQASAGVLLPLLAGVSMRMMISGLPALGWLVLPIIFCELAVGVYLMHFFCWYLGSLYRQHEEQMPWVWQEFERARRTGQPHAP